MTTWNRVTSNNSPSVRFRMEELNGNVSLKYADCTPGSQ